MPIHRDRLLGGENIVPYESINRLDTGSEPMLVVLLAKTKIKNPQNKENPSNERNERRACRNGCSNMVTDLNES